MKAAKEIDMSWKDFLDETGKRDGALDTTTEKLIALGIALEMIGHPGGGPAITFGAKALEAYDAFAAA